MKLKLFLEHRFKRTPDGQVWSPIFLYETFTRYLRIFSEVTLCARVADVPAVAGDVGPATGSGVKLAGLPYYHGPHQYWQQRKRFRAAVSALITPNDAYIVRVPGNVADVAIRSLQAASVPHAVEAVADPWDMFSPGASTHLLRWLFRRTFTRSMRRHCAQAAVSLYVTEHALQRRYPPKGGTQAFTHAVSDVCLNDAAFVETTRPAKDFAGRPLRFVCVGSFNLLYKAQDILVKAFAQAVEQGLDGHLTFVGDGIYRPAIEAFVKSQTLKGRVQFLGQLRGGGAVREVLDRSHIFVLPSRQEGLPRAALEAMARGLPCIGSNVGGFPEILGQDAVVPPGDIRALAGCLFRLAADPEKLANMSACNLRRAADFHADKLTVRQDAYYVAVHELFADFWRQPATLTLSEACSPADHSGKQLDELVPSLGSLKCTPPAAEK